MMPLGGGRAIITLRAADRDCGRRRGYQRSWEMTCCHFIPVLSLCRWWNVGHGRVLWWRARLAYFNQWSGQTYPKSICRSSGCYVCECRVPLLEEVRIGEARHVYSWENPDGGNPNENACHVSSGGGVPTIPFFMIVYIKVLSVFL